MIKLFLSVISLSMVLISCNSAKLSKVAPYKGKAPSSMGYYNEASLSKDSFGEGVGRLVIFDANLVVLVRNVDSLNAGLAEIARRYEGYAVTLGNRRSTIRVASKNLQAAILGISGYGKVKSKTLSGSDVTDQYNDFEIRLDNANKSRLRYLELLAKAENVEAALKVEKELERLNLEIETLKGKMQQLKHLSDYSTIAITIEEKPKLGIVGYMGLGVYKVIKWLIVRD